MNIGIRADGSPDIGMGHIIRCISLAAEFRKAGCTVYFISRYQDGIKRIKTEGFDVIELPEGIDSLEEEAFDISKITQSYAIEVLIVDTYRVSEGFLLKLKNSVKKLAYIDDINKFIYPVDILINGNITGEYLNYRKYSENELMFLGPKFNLIRNEFKNLPQRTINEEVKEIMLTTGGSDPHNLSARFVKALLRDNELKDLIINVVVGGLFVHKDSLRELARDNANIVLHENVKYMSEIMMKSDIAISAGGSTLYELCACGTPAVTFIMVDNQEFLVEKMHQLGYVESLGWYNRFSDIEFLNRVNELCKDQNKRETYSRRMRKLVDGRGAQSVVRGILEEIS